MMGSLLEYFTSENISIVQVILTLGLACVNAVYLFVVYRMLGRKTIYSKRYSITVSGVLVITTAIIFATYTSVTLSLGVVGALAIIRFRTAIKEPLDIAYLFWAVTAGLCYGAHMAEIAILLSAFLTILIFYLESLSIKQGSRILIVERSPLGEDEIVSCLQKFSKKYTVKTMEQDGSIQKIVIELNTKKEYELVKEMILVNGVQAVSLIAHKNEHSY